MTKNFHPAIVFPTGEFIREELEARKWTRARFANILGRPISVVNKVLDGKVSITFELAKEIGLALGTGPELWLNLEATYLLATTEDPDPKIAKRAMAAT